MRLSRIIIKNFRNFKSLDVKLGEHAVVLGENKVGKTNLLFAPRLILDPVWSKISNALKRLGFRFHNFLAQPLSETSRVCTIRVRRSSFREALE